MSLPKPYYQDEAVTLYHADCKQILPFLDKFDLLLTDPPYGIGADKMTLGNGRQKIYRGNSEWDSRPPARWQIEQMVDMSQKAILWGGNYFALPETRCFLVWDKGTGQNDFADCELAWTNLDSVVKKHFQSWVGANAKDKNSARVHPTQKPLALIRWCLSLVPDAKTILDCYAGSGTTGVAAKLEGRKSTLIELDERYCEIAANRLRQKVLF